MKFVIISTWNINLENTERKTEVSASVFFCIFLKFRITTGLNLLAKAAKHSPPPHRSFEANSLGKMMIPLFLEDDAVRWC